MKTKIPGNADDCCDDPKSGIRPPAIAYINGNKARKEKIAKCRGGQLF